VTLLTGSAATWRFTWQDGRVDVAVLRLLASVDTSAGPQSYELTVAAPLAAFGRMAAIFRQMLPTFLPLP
jgi:hypothetical protein